jgi:hypothetical protein
MLTDSLASRERTFSNDHDFRSYGVLIKELRMLSRSIFIVDALGTARYVQLVKDLIHEPDDDDVMASLETLGQEVDV